jgi:hypothetical protein
MLALHHLCWRAPLLTSSVMAAALAQRPSGGGFHLRRSRPLAGALGRGADRGHTPLCAHLRGGLTAQGPQVAGSARDRLPAMLPQSRGRWRAAPRNSGNLLSGITSGPNPASGHDHQSGLREHALEQVAYP